MASPRFSPNYVPRLPLSYAQFMIWVAVAWFTDKELMRLLYKKSYSWSKCFCILDLNKVIHGSYNWTNRAQYNKETFTISESREVAEKFAQEFIELKNSA